MILLQLFGKFETQCAKCAEQGKTLLKDQDE
jgi:hypothetical protein